MKLPFVRGVTRKCSLPSSSKWHRRPVSAHFHRGVSALSQTPNVLFPASGLRVNWAVVSSFLLSLSGYSRHETRVPSCVFTALLCLLRRRENKFRGHPKWISTNPDENLKRVKYLGGSTCLSVTSTNPCPDLFTQTVVTGCLAYFVTNVKLWYAKRTLSIPTSCLVDHKRKEPVCPTNLRIVHTVCLLF